MGGRRPPKLVHFSGNQTCDRHSTHVLSAVTTTAVRISQLFPTPSQFLELNQ